MSQFAGVTTINYMNQPFDLAQHGFTVEQVLETLNVDRSTTDFEIIGSTLYITQKSGTKGFTDETDNTDVAAALASVFGVSAVKREAGKKIVWTEEGFVEVNPYFTVTEAAKLAELGINVKVPMTDEEIWAAKVALEKSKVAEVATFFGKELDETYEFVLKFKEALFSVKGLPEKPETETEEEA